jgi:SAM-dependent methyltransferase
MVTSSEAENLRIQRNQHPLVSTDPPTTLEEYFIHLIHKKAYETAASLAAGHTVLDYGCNDGHGISIMASVAKFVVGLDVSPSALLAARSRIPTADLCLYAGGPCPFREESFDLVVSCQVIEHIVNCHQYLVDICRVLRPGGTALFTTPNACIRLEPGEAPWNPFHVKEFRPWELSDLLKAYFSRIALHGLFAIEEIEATEVHRVARQRKSAASWAGRLSRSAIAPCIRTVFPRPVLDWARRLVGRTTLHSECALPQEVMEKYTTDDFFYRTEDLERSLDLMVVCNKAR